MSRAKKLVLVSATFSLVTKANKEEHVFLERVPCTYYPLRFCKGTAGVRVLIDSGSEVNAMSPVYTSKLGLKVHHTNVEAQKIDGSTFKTFGMVLAGFQVEDKFRRIWFFQETFLLADINAKIVLGMPFFTFSNADVQFIEKKFI